MIDSRLRVLFLLLALGGIAASPTAAAAPLESTPRTLKSRSGVSIQAERGTLHVPENRANPGSRSIAIGWLRLKARTATPRPALFYLEGGPGSPAVSEQPDVLERWSKVLDICDVVLVDQRGTNDSLLTWRWSGPPPRSYFLHADSARRHFAELERRAAAAIRGRGVDLAGYTTVESADDLDALRSALGYERISLLGFSYGTHLAIAYLRRHGAHVESAVLVGTEGPDHTEKLPWTFDVQFRKLALVVAADSAIGPRIPDLVALHDRVVARLDRAPAVIPVALRGGGTLDVPVAGFGLRLLMRWDIGDASDLVVLPRLLWSLDRGDTTELAWFLRKRAGAGLGTNAMNRVMDLASGASAARRAIIDEQSRTSRFADVVNFPVASAANWGIEPLSSEFRAPLVSPVRTLFLSGDLDFNAPPWQAEEVRWGMPQATHIAVANAGHEQVLNDTAVPVVLDFLRGVDVAGRTITYPPLRFMPLEGPPGPGAHPAAGR